MKKSCVLVSGGAGYIGSHTSVELINAAQVLAAKEAEQIEGEKDKD